MNSNYLGWFGIIRLGLVQAALGSIVVLTTSTMNRVMIVELMLPAMLPGALVVLHYVVQISRPRWGYSSDMGGRRTPWILGGMFILALGGIGAASSTALMAVSTNLGIALAILAFITIGIGVGAAGTSLLALLATNVAPERRAAAASITFIMMIAGFAITTAIVGNLLDPYSHQLLILITAGVAIIALLVTFVAVWGLESSIKMTAEAKLEAVSSEPKVDFHKALIQVWAEPQARRFTIFVFVSMLAYNVQDIILEPFAGLVFNYSPGESTRLSSLQNTGTLIGMIVVAVMGTISGGHSVGSLRIWTFAGCLASALSLLGLSLGAYIGEAWPLKANVFILGLSNGAFAVAAIGSMMGLAGAGRESREGMRMGLWGAAQALAFGLGVFLGAACVDIARSLLGTPEPAYALVFAGEGLLFVLAAVLSVWVGRSSADRARLSTFSIGENYLADANGR